jgi:nucleoside-diphosphate-sugar epimerase
VGFFAKRKVLVTGGASFIGSHLTRALLEAGALVSVADDYSSGAVANLGDAAGEVRLVEADLRSGEAAATACAGAEMVFHLAAAHGGRGYIDTHGALCAQNMLIDQNVYQAALKAGTGKAVFASSACVYPGRLQRPDAREALREDLTGPPYDPDGLYGMAKLAGELALRALAAEHGMSAAICRYFTVFGPMCGESHAIMAMIARAFIGADPFEIWGTGNQVRSWIYVDDVVRMTMLAAERIDDGRAVNVASDEPLTVRAAAEIVLDVTGHQARIVARPDMPTGPLHRTASTRLARELLGCPAQVTFAEGVRRTARWYYAARDRRQVAASLGQLLMERHPQLPVPAAARR